MTQPGFAGKTVRVAGGPGIGAATAQLLGARGGCVVLSYLRDQTSAEAVAAEIQAVGGVARPVQAEARDPGPSGLGVPEDRAREYADKFHAARAIATVRAGQRGA